MTNISRYIRSLFADRDLYFKSQERFQMPENATPYLGLRTVVYHVSDLSKAKLWYASVLEMEPYFDEPFYVGFNVGGFELGLHPNDIDVENNAASSVAYWGVSDASKQLARLVELGATLRSEIQEVGGGIKVADVSDPFGNVFGIIENPHFPNTA